MAVYKVAQDVEADDKLIGPFSFRQFVYLIIVALAGALAWGLSRIFVGLAIIPLPVILFFGALALPLRKDQPMEVYLAALISFYLKPRKRLWSPDGIESLIEITAPKVVEVKRSKDLSQSEAERRLSYLADIADTKGWAIRHSTAPVSGSSMNADIYNSAQETEDILDASGGIAQSFNTMISQADERRHQDMLQKMQTATQPAPVAPVAQTPIAPVQLPPMPTPAGLVQAQTTAVDPFTLPPSTQPFAAPQAPMPSLSTAPQFNPYPTIHQSVIQPLSAQAPQTQLAAIPTTPTPAAAYSPAVTQPEQTPIQAQPVVPVANTPENTSEIPISPDIINLASNPDLSIETIQREANRIQQKKDDASSEVYVSLH